MGRLVLTCCLNVCCNVYICRSTTFSTTAPASTSPAMPARAASSQPNCECSSWIVVVVVFSLHYFTCSGATFDVRVHTHTHTHTHTHNARALLVSIADVQLPSEAPRAAVNYERLPPTMLAAAGSCVKNEFVCDVDDFHIITKLFSLCLSARVYVDVLN